MIDLRENKFLVLEGESESVSLVILSVHKTESDALDAMKQKISTSNSPYLIAEVKHLSDDYRKNFKYECDIEITKREERIKMLQSEISDLRRKRERGRYYG